MALIEKVDKSNDNRRFTNTKERIDEKFASTLKFIQGANTPFLNYLCIFSNLNYTEI